MFDENLLMAICSIGALVTGQYHEAAAVILFYKVGLLLEDLAEYHFRHICKGTGTFAWHSRDHNYLGRSFCRRRSDLDDSSEYTAYKVQLNKKQV